MTYADHRSCIRCAWRETCQKRFSSTDDMGLRCPEYTYDVTLDRKVKQEQNHVMEHEKTGTPPDSPTEKK